MGKIEHYLGFKEKNADKIATLATQIGEITEDAHWDLIEGMKGVLGAAAANESTDDESDQDEALSTAESWVTDNCSDGGIAEDVAMALWLRGDKDGEAHLGKVAMTKTPDVETLIKASLQHGLDSESDHEAGDLQEYLRAGWGLLTTNQRTTLLSQPRMKSAVETASGEDLRVTEKLLQDEGLEHILGIFQQHGKDEGAEAEVTDLQDALRSCWDELTKDQRSKLLELDSVQETYENAVMEPLFPKAAYLASPGWGHIFVGKREEITRWIYDREKDELVSAQVLNANAWVDLDPAPMADLLESLRDNDVNGKSDDFGLTAFDSLPSWEEIGQIAVSSDGDESQLRPRVSL